MFKLMMNSMAETKRAKFDPRKKQVQKMREKAKQGKIKTKTRGKDKRHEARQQTKTGDKGRRQETRQ